MFTGIVEGMGTVSRLVRKGGAIRFEVRAPQEIVSGFKPGDSVAVNGACVTVTDTEGDVFAADLVPETLGRTNLGTLQAGEEVNLERPLAAGGRLDGHIVQGHVDVVGLVRSRRRVGAQELLEVNIPFELTRYLAAKGSVAVDGVSLTVVDVNKDRFRVALIPHTIAATTLGKKIQGQAVNVEVDILSKYVERHIAARMPQRPPSIAALVAMQDAETRAAQAAPPAPAPSVAQTPRPAAAPMAPKGHPVQRPAPPPREQPARFIAPVMKRPAAAAHAPVAPKPAPRSSSRPAPKPSAKATAKPKAGGTETAKPKAGAKRVAAAAKTKTRSAAGRSKTKSAPKSTKKGKR